MAIMKNLILGACALATLVQARPVQNVIVTEIVTQTHWTTIDCVKTVWLPFEESAAPTSDSTAGQSPTPVSASAVEATSTPPPAPATSTVTTSVLPPPPPPQTTTPAYNPPAATTEAASPVVTTTQAPAPAVTTTTTTQAPVPAAPAPTITTTTTTEAPAPLPTTSQAAAVAAPSSAPGSFVEASASNSCEGTGAACEGEVTHYDGGLGACGWTVDTEGEMAVALPVGLMGAQSNGNPYCGRTITIKNPTSGTTVTAKVGDKCMGCQGRAIDLTNKLFKAVTDGTGDGRESGFQWWFTD